MASEKIAKLIEEVKNLTVLELSELVKALETEFGVSAAAPVAVAVNNSGSTVQAAEEEAEEQTEFEVVLTESGQSKVSVIKVVREATGLGLREAKAVVDEAPKSVKDGMSKQDAEALVAKLKEAGATAEIK